MVSHWSAPWLSALMFTSPAIALVLAVPARSPTRAGRAAGWAVCAALISATLPVTLFYTGVKLIGRAPPRCSGTRNRSSPCYRIHRADETLTALQLVGGALIVGGVVPPACEARRPTLARRRRRAEIASRGMTPPSCSGLRAFAASPDRRTRPERRPRTSSVILHRSPCDRPARFRRRRTDLRGVLSPLFWADRCGYLLAFRAFRGVGVVARSSPAKVRRDLRDRRGGGHGDGRRVLPVAVVGVVLAAMGRGAAEPRASSGRVVAGLAASSYSVRRSPTISASTGFLLIRLSAFASCSLRSANGAWRSWTRDPWRVLIWAWRTPRPISSSSRLPSGARHGGGRPCRPVRTVAVLVGRFRAASACSPPAARRRAGHRRRQRIAATGG
jgi:hypothetical protein